VVRVAEKKSGCSTWPFIAGTGRPSTPARSG
jgi:hypothetical protein